MSKIFNYIAFSTPLLGLFKYLHTVMYVWQTCLLECASNFIRESFGIWFLCRLRAEEKNVYETAKENSIKKRFSNIHYVCLSDLLLLLYLFSLQWVLLISARKSAAVFCLHAFYEPYVCIIIIIIIIISISGRQPAETGIKLAKWQGS